MPTAAVLKLNVKFALAKPVIAPKEVNEPEPPIVELVAIWIGLERVIDVPRARNAPVPPVPLPFKLIAFVLVSALLLKFISNVPAETVVPDVLPSAPTLLSLKVPLEIVVVPL